MAVPWAQRRAAEVTKTVLYSLRVFPVWRIIHHVSTDLSPSIVCRIGGQELDSCVIFNEQRVI